MPSNKPLMKTYIDKIYKDKFKYIADQDHRSDSNMLEKLVIDFIEDYEIKHGEIITKEDGTMTTAKPKELKPGKSSTSKTG